MRCLEEEYARGKVAITIAKTINDRPKTHSLGRPSRFKFDSVLGDVLRLTSSEAGRALAGLNLNQRMDLAIAALMLLPSSMMFLTLVRLLPAHRWATISRAGFLLLIHLVGLPT